jgi:hypothetical protein
VRAFGSVQEMLSLYLAHMAQRFGAATVEHHGGRRYVARRQDGGKLRMLADEGIGLVEGDEGFQDA